MWAISSTASDARDRTTTIAWMKRHSTAVIRGISIARSTGVGSVGSRRPMLVVCSFDVAGVMGHIVRIVWFSTRRSCWETRSKSSSFLGFLPTTERSISSVPLARIVISTTTSTVNFAATWRPILTPRMRQPRERPATGDWFLMADHLTLAIVRRMRRRRNCRDPRRRWKTSAVSTTARNGRPTIALRADPRNESVPATEASLGCYSEQGQGEQEGYDRSERQTRRLALDTTSALETGSEPEARTCTVSSEDPWVI